MEQEPEAEKVERPVRRPWQILNERDKGVIVTHFLHGLSPSQIATLTKRSIPFVYEVLQSEEAQDAIAEFEKERENGLIEVNTRLQRATATLTDELLVMALSGSKESNRLNAIKHGLALAGMVPVQKVAQVSAKVVIQGATLERARETMGWIKSRGQGNGNSDSVLDQIAGALNATGPGRAVSIDLSASRAAAPGMAGDVQGEHVLPGQGGAWVRQDDFVPSLADLRDVAEPSPEAEVVGPSTGPLQEHDGHEDVPTVAADQRSIDPNPYY